MPIQDLENWETKRKKTEEEDTNHVFDCFKIRHNGYRLHMKTESGRNIHAHGTAHLLGIQSQMGSLENMHTETLYRQSWLYLEIHVYIHVYEYVITMKKEP